MKSLYYSPELNQFRMFSGIMYSPYYTFTVEQVKTLRGLKTGKFCHHPGAGERWVRVCERTVGEAQSRIESAMAEGQLDDETIGDVTVSLQERIAGSHSTPKALNAASLGSE